MPLSDKQQLFVQEYLVDRNGRQAAIRAGYSARNPGYQAHRLLQNPEVAEAVGEGLQGRTARLEVTAERVIEEIARRAFYDPTDLMVEVEQALEDGEGSPFDATGRLLKALPEDTRRAIDGWGRDRHGNLVIKLADKNKALDQLARHLGLYRAVDVRVTHVSQRINAGRNRLARRDKDESE